MIKKKLTKGKHTMNAYQMFVTKILFNTKTYPDAATSKIKRHIFTVTGAHKIWESNEPALGGWCVTFLYTVNVKTCKTAQSQIEQYLDSDSDMFAISDIIIKFRIAAATPVLPTEDEAVIEASHTGWLNHTTPCYHYPLTAATKTANDTDNKHKHLIDAVDMIFNLKGSD